MRSKATGLTNCAATGMYARRVAQSVPEKKAVKTVLVHSVQVEV
eukprot:COSAG02_NODE_2051_length_10000_cov_2.340471_14_plen_44_part_00